MEYRKLCTGLIGVVCCLLKSLEFRLPGSCLRVSLFSWDCWAAEEPCVTSFVLLNDEDPFELLKDVGSLLTSVASGILLCLSLQRMETL